MAAWVAERSVVPEQLGALWPVARISPFRSIQAANCHAVDDALLAWCGTNRSMSQLSSTLPTTLRSRRPRESDKTRRPFRILVAGGRHKHFDCGPDCRRYSHAARTHSNYMYSGLRRSNSVPGHKADRLAGFCVSHKSSDGRARSFQRARWSGRHFQGSRPHRVWRTEVGNLSRLSHTARPDLVPRPPSTGEVQQPQTEPVTTTEA